MSWSARQYTSSEAQRTRPARDLVAAIPVEDARRAVDLGCGPGNSTAVLAARYPEATIVGVDNDDDMLASARQRLPTIEFVRADIASWQPAAPVDVVLANASLQWLPDHATLYPRLLGHVAPGGALAIQTPDNEQEPAHVALRQVAQAGPWAARVANVHTLTRHSAAFYYALLAPLAGSVEVWRTVYHHPLPNHDAVVEWFKGSGMRPYLAPLDARERAAFLARYCEAIEAGYPALPDGTVLLPFPRLFIVATR